MRESERFAKVKVDLPSIKDRAMRNFFTGARRKIEHLGGRNFGQRIPVVQPP